MNQSCLKKIHLLVHSEWKYTVRYIKKILELINLLLILGKIQLLKI